MVLNHGASSAAARLAAAAAAPAAGPYASVSAAAIAAAQAAGEAAREREDEADATLVERMVVAAHEAAEAAGQPLDAAALVQVMRAAARLCLDRRERREAAAQEAAAAGAAAARDATATAARRSPEELEAALAAAAAGQLAPPELLEVQSASYEHGGERRRHTWVMMDWGEQHLQLGRQQFMAYPRQAGSAEEEEKDEEEEYPAWRASQAAFEAEQQRRYGLLPAAGLTEPEWGRLEWIAARARDQPGWLQELEQDVQQPAVQREQQQGSGGGGKGFGGSGGGGKQGRRKKGKAKAARASGAAADAAAAEAAEKGLADGEEEEEEEEEEELFPFTYDWERQRRRRSAGEILRALLGDNFDRAMAQVGVGVGGVGWLGRAQRGYGTAAHAAPEAGCIPVQQARVACLRARGWHVLERLRACQYAGAYPCAIQPARPALGCPVCSVPEHLRSCRSGAVRAAAAPIRLSSRRRSRRAPRGWGAHRRSWRLLACRHLLACRWLCLQPHPWLYERVGSLALASLACALLPLQRKEGPSDHVPHAPGSRASAPAGQWRLAP